MAPRRIRLLKRKLQLQRLAPVIADQYGETIENQLADLAKSRALTPATAVMWSEVVAAINMVYAERGQPLIALPPPMHALVNEAASRSMQSVHHAMYGSAGLAPDWLVKVIVNHANERWRYLHYQEGEPTKEAKHEAAEAAFKLETRVFGKGREPLSVETITSRMRKKLPKLPPLSADK
jgi:hypothetical protein